MINKQFYVNQQNREQGPDNCFVKVLGIVQGEQTLKNYLNGTILQDLTLMIKNDLTETEKDMLTNNQRHTQILVFSSHLFDGC